MSIEDIKIIAEVLEGILNPNNEIRNTAVSKLDQLRENTPGLLYCLLKIIDEMPDKNIKTTAAVLIRKILEIKEHELVNPAWAKMTTDVKEEIKKLAIEIFAKETDQKIKMKLCDIINQIAENVYESEEKWDDLTAIIFKILSLELNNENLQNIEGGLGILAGVFGFVYDDLVQKMDVIINALRSYFKTTVLSLKTRAARSVAEMIAYCDKKENKLFQEFIFNIMETTFKCYEDPKEENNLKYCLKSITDISTTEPGMFKKHWDDLYVLMGKISEKKDYLDENIRELGFEVIVNLVERRNNLFMKDEAKTKNFLEQLYKYSLEMEKEVTDDWATPTTNSYFDEEFIYEEKVSSAFSFIDRLIEHLDTKYLLPYLSEVISQLIQNDKDWRYKYVSLLSTSQVIFYIDDITTIESFFAQIFDHVNHSNPKVRYAAINCINEMSENFQPHFQNNYHEKVLHLLIDRINSEPVLRCQLETFEALNTFVDHCSKDIMGLYLQVTLDTIFGMFLKEVPVSLREEILETTAELVSTSQKDFAPYAEKCLKILIDYFVVVYTNKSMKSLYGNLIECITIIGPYASDIYYSFIPDLVKTIIEIQDNIPLSTDPIRNYLQEALERLIPIMKDHFRGQLPSIINSVIKLVQTVPEMSVSSNPEDQFKIEDLFKSDEPQVKVESNKTSIKTSQTEEMASAIELLNTTIEALQDLFIPYIELAQKEIFPLLKYYINEDVRIQASNTLPIIMGIIAQYTDKDTTILYAKAYTAELIQDIEKEFDNVTLSAHLENLGDVILRAGILFLNKDEINQIFERLLKMIDEVEVRRIKLITKKESLKKTSHKKQTNHDEDEEEEDDEDFEKDLEKDIEEIENIQSSMADVIGFLFKTHKEVCEDIVNKIVNQMLPKYFSTGSSTFEIKMGIFIADDMIEYLGQEYLGHLWKELARAVFTFCDSTDCAVRQAACYGVGVFAEHTKADFNLYAEDCLRCLGKALAIPADEYDETEWGTARDNAVASLGRIVKHQGKCVDLQICINQWIRYLPITYDTNESVEQHDLLCDIITSRSDLILGENHANLPLLIRILARINKTKYSSNEINAKIEQIFTALKNDQTTLKVLTDTRESSEDKIRKKINKFFE